MNTPLSRYARLEHRLRQFLGRWFFRMRGPEPGEIFLSQRRVYILPTHPGLLFGATLITLFIASINYSLNLGFALTFLLGAIGFVDMHMTFRNLAHLNLSSGKASPVFAGEHAQFELHIHNRRRKHRYALWLDFVHDFRKPDTPQAIDVAAHSATSLILTTLAAQRGWLQAPRVRLQTRFPLGLFRAWTYWHPDARALVYPAPENNAPPLPLRGSASAQGGCATGNDDFAGVRGYQEGDPLKHLAWRQIARLDTGAGQPLVTKVFDGGSAADIALDLTALPHSIPLEIRLSRLTRWVIEAERRALPYSLQLGKKRIAPGLGQLHHERCLRALALYGVAP